MRVTNSMLSGRALRDLQASYSALAKAQEQVSSGKRLNRPSDDPAGVRTSVRVRDTLNALDQHLRNLDVADRATAVAEGALASGGGAMQRIKELALQAANDSLTPADRATVLQEVRQLGDSLVALANTKNGDDYVFSGQQTRTPAFASLGAPYGGDTQPIVARIAPSATTTINITGDVAWQPALTAVAQLVTDLGTGTGRPSATTLQGLDDGFAAMLSQRTKLGAIQNRLADTRLFVGDQQDTATKLLSDLEDADAADVIATYANRQATYEAAIAVNAKILRRSLVDEL